MRHQDVRVLLQQLIIARDECSREWRLSDTVVMCLEFDLFWAMTPWSRSVPEHSERRHGVPPQLVKITFFDVPSTSRVEEESLSPPARALAAELRTMVSDWVCGRIDRMPPSTSTALSIRLRS
jgi:hypothetical protein